MVCDEYKNISKIDQVDILNTLIDLIHDEYVEYKVMKI